MIEKSRCLSEKTGREIRNFGGERSGSQTGHNENIISRGSRMELYSSGIETEEVFKDFRHFAKLLRRTIRICSYKGHAASLIRTQRCRE